MAAKPRRRLPVLRLVAVPLVIAVLGGAAYWLVGHKSAANRTAAAPTGSRAPARRGASLTPVQASARARADSLRRIAAAHRAFIAATTGRLVLNVEPPTADIYVDTTPSGSAGFLDSDVTAGRRHLAIIAAGFDAFDTTVTVPLGDVLDLGQISLRTPAEKAAAIGRKGLLQFTVDPGFAQIFVNDRRVGSGALVNWPVYPGEVSVRITAPGYETYDTVVRVAVGTTVRLPQITLKR